MPSLLDRVTFHGNIATLTRTGVGALEAVESLERGAPPEDLCRERGLVPADLIAAVAVIGLGPDDHPAPGLVQARPSWPNLAPALEEPALARLFPGIQHINARLCLSSGLLQIHDFWDASHHAAQRADDLGERSFSAWWHMIAHRREPDPGNAAYWSRRVGNHPLLEPLGARIRNALHAQGEAPLADRLAPGRSYSPSAMIDACSRVKPESDSATPLRKAQRMEMALLLEATAAQLIS
jgi:hypothetical protein